MTDLINLTPDDLDERLKVQASKDQLVNFTAERIAKIAKATLQVNDRFALALSGGSTPRPVYESLGRDFGETLDWSRVHLFFGDERCVPPDHDDSNFKMVSDAWLRYGHIPPQNVHRIHGEDDPQAAAAAYEAELRAFFADDVQLFDLNLLGMGDDGHTASLFPRTAVVHELDRWVVPNYVESKAGWRISLTRTAILNSANIMFLVSGTNKAAALQQVLAGPIDVDQYPAQVVARSTHPHVVLAVDADAASQL